MIGPLVRISALVGVAKAQLARAPGRTVLAVVAVALAVLSVTLFASLGVGVVSVGQDRIEETDRDVWITSDPVDGSTGGTENAIVGAHAISADVSQRDDVSRAAPIGLYTTYVGTDPADLRPITAVGVYETHGGFDFESGSGFDGDRDALDVPPGETDATDVVVDPTFADELGVTVGDTVYVGVGASGESARAFTVVGTADLYSQYLGEPTITMRLTELQGLAGSRGTDRAAFVTVDVADGADSAAVSDDLAAAYPQYDVRTSDEQFLSMIRDRGLVVTSGAALVGLSVVGGIVLTANLFVLLAYQQRQQLAALRAVGLSRPVIAGLVGVQGFIIGAVGGAVALVATGPITGQLNAVVRDLVGYGSLLQTPPSVYALGAVVAIAIGSIAAVAGGWSASRYACLSRL
ncbi:ABC transporter permease [Halovivax cerinus]|uniref:ABC transporter permease n=1 Tax=Halovivax cerinus TaxID=1487865 RepID=A0ABD5NMC1_9EURY|nr:ABC transporter permease [Halovivax cerinus]